MQHIINNIPNIGMPPLQHVFENMKLQHKENTLWLEFGVATGQTINYISQFTKGDVFGFDSFEGLPEFWKSGCEKGTFSSNGIPPLVNDNVKLIQGWFNETLPGFVQTQLENTGKKISFIHIDCDLYSSTKSILDHLKNYIDKDCIIIFDELVNYHTYDGDTGELKAFYEFILENNVKYNWIGINGRIYHIDELQGFEPQAVALQILNITPLKNLKSSTV